jgi:phosphohistidine swiveling domain-containing protein
MIARHFRMGDLIFYLEYDEVLKLANHNREIMRLLALQRQAYFEACKLHKIKKVIIDLESSPFHKEEVKREESSDKRYKFITGKTIYYGNAEGVCLAAKTNEEYLKKLADFRNKNISSIIGVFKGVELSYFNLSALSGFTTENGGYLAHAATIAREFKIPYITNVNFDHFRDGDYVILDTENDQVIYRR